MGITVADRFRSSAFQLRWPLGLGFVVAIFLLLQAPLTHVGSAFAHVFGGVVLWIISKPALHQYSLFAFMKEDWSEFASLFANHVALAIEAVVWAVAISLPIGLLIHRLPRLYLPSFVVLDSIYAIPSLAAFPVLIQIPQFGISYKTVITIVVAYAQFILVRNVLAGLNSVPSEVKEAARGMGLSRLQILMEIEFPLALPVIVAGIRIAAVAAIGIVSIGALTGIPDLGHFFFSSRNGGGNASAEVGCAVVGVIFLALISDILFRILEAVTPANRALRTGSGRGWRHWILLFQSRVTWRRRFNLGACAGGSSPGSAKH